MKARVIIGSNYGDEGKGTIVARYAKNCTNSLNILTNGGAQRGHSIMSDKGCTTFQHFGSGTYYGSDNFFSRFFILNPMQFVKEYNELIIKPNIIYRDVLCKFTTPFDMMSNLITEEQQHRHASCRMGVWNTIKRYKEFKSLSFEEFINHEKKEEYLKSVKKYYENQITIPIEFKNVWNSENIIKHFINDCMFMANLTKLARLDDLHYDDLIFENGQGLLLSDDGTDRPDKTPSKTGSEYAKQLISELNNDCDVTLHYVTRTYLTRHGDGFLVDETNKKNLSQYIEEDMCNHFNEGQGHFRYGKINIDDLKQRIITDANGYNTIIEVTHCDEIDNTNEFKSKFNNINFYDNPYV